MWIKLKIEDINYRFEELVNLQRNINKNKGIEDIGGDEEQKKKMASSPIKCSFQDLDVRLAVDVELNHHLLIQTNLKKEDVEEDIKSQGIQLKQEDITILYEGKQTKITVMDIFCTIQSLNKLFIYFVHDLVRRINDLSKDGNINNLTKDEVDKIVNKLCISALNSWRKLFSQQKERKIMSEQKIIGLWGELFFLRKLLNENPYALDYWIGPEKTKFDFLNGLNAIEVKTSKKTEGRSVEIHGIDQLEPHNGGSLHLLYLKIEEIESGESIPCIVEDLIAITANTLETYKLLDKLFTVGYEHGLSDKYEPFKYQIREERLYVVDNDFPKITLDSFKNGAMPNNVSDINYKINLTGEPPEPLSENGYSEYVKEFAR